MVSGWREVRTHVCRAQLTPVIKSYYLLYHRLLNKTVQYSDQRLLIGVRQQIRLLPQGMQCMVADLHLFRNGFTANQLIQRYLLYIGNLKPH